MHFPTTQNSHIKPETSIPVLHKNDVKIYFKMQCYTNNEGMLMLYENPSINEKQLYKMPKKN